MMKMNKWLCATLCLLMLVAALALNASAAGKLDVNTECSLTLYYADGETPLTGTDFAIYYLAQIDENADFTLADAFQNYPVDFSQVKDEANWAKLALTFAGYVDRDKIKETASAQTNDNGSISMEHLKAGLYLVLGGACETENGVYTAIPALVCLPSQNEAGEYFYDVIIYPKHEKTVNPGETIELKVLKKWADNNNPNRPQEITVELLCDGKTVDSVKLNRQNSWTHTWKDLEPDHVYNVTEREVAGYKVEVIKDGSRFTITNSGNYTPPSPPPENPQTGLLWWPVPVLFGTGLFFVVLALIRRRNSPVPAKK